jgi:hypothetical protein
MGRDGPIQLSLHLLDFGKVGIFAASSLRRARSVQAFDIPELQAITRARPVRRTSVLGVGVPDSLADSTPARGAVEDVVDRLTALHGRGAALDVRASDGMNQVPDAPTLESIEPHTRLVLDATWSSGTHGQLAVTLEIVDRWGLVGDDAEAFRDLVRAICICCSDAERAPALPIREDFQSYDRERRSH